MYDGSGRSVRAIQICDRNGLWDAMRRDTKGATRKVPLIQKMRRHSTGGVPCHRQRRTVERNEMEIGVEFGQMLGNKLDRPWAKMGVKTRREHFRRGDDEWGEEIWAVECEMGGVDDDADELFTRSDAVETVIMKDGGERRKTLEELFPLRWSPLEWRENPDVRLGKRVVDAELLDGLEGWSTKKGVGESTGGVAMCRCVVKSDSRARSSTATSGRLPALVAENGGRSVGIDWVNGKTAKKI
ncbi:hypothetical protein B0H11DRAFT_2205645 [Mycena galericulata]|nr:hypothetical protein B0H11DRAFT_2205645 [Mycena galericulata]